MSRDHSRHETVVLKKSFSHSYPNMDFQQALKKESEKLQMELQRSQSNLDVQQCEVIQRLIDVTEAVASVPEKSSPVKGSKITERKYSDANNAKGNSFNVETHWNSDARITSRFFYFCFQCIVNLKQS